MLCIMSVDEVFACWRQISSTKNSWGLAWFLAYQFCRRFYASHGIVPYVIEHEGLGYYGIQLCYFPCKVNGNRDEKIGRMTMAGDVENWQRGEPVDHGLETAKQCEEGVSTDKLINQALRHMALTPWPVHSHLNCRHKRWGSSYELVFEVATIIALRNNTDVKIWNHPYHTRRVLQELDPKSSMDEHPGAFIFDKDDNRVVVAGDGRLLDGSKRNLWEQYMMGEVSYSLAMCIEEMLSRA